MRTRSLSTCSRRRFVSDTRNWRWKSDCMSVSFARSSMPLRRRDSSARPAAAMLFPLPGELLSARLKVIRKSAMSEPPGRIGVGEASSGVSVAEDDGACAALVASTRCLAGIDLARRVARVDEERVVDGEERREAGMREEWVHTRAIARWLVVPKRKPSDRRENEV